MADESLEDELRQMAQHRGLKLVKSRRRKPGTGDYGKYGLTDASGTALVGIGEGGLTASPHDITSYLRKGAAGTWKESADTIPDVAPPMPMPMMASSSADAEEGPRRKSSNGPHPGRAKPAPKARAAADDDALGGRTRVPKAAKPKIGSQPEREPEPDVKPTLNIRLAEPADMAALAQLLGQLSGITVGGDAVEANLAAVRKLKGNMVIAEYGPLVGCCAWGLIPTIHRGMVGRLTVLVVDEGHRRRGFATALLDAAIAALAKSSCILIEAMSDIEIKNAHNFFRSRSFDQTSYRFERNISD
jgi:ribosomal protein S18 acetylase RimI-like enzyme